MSDAPWTLRDEILASERRLITMCDQVAAGTRQGGAREFERMIDAQFREIKKLMPQEEVKRD